jgi:hypothetical protein
MRLKKALAIGTAMGTGLLAATCSTQPASDIGLVMVAPQGVLDEADALSLKVFPAEGHACSADGSVAEVPADAKSFKLTQDGCDAGVKWCGDLTLDQDGSTQMFFVQASSAGGVLGQGCAKKAIDQDPLEVTIKIVRFVAEACCGDGALQAGELCDGGGSDTCDGSTADAICQADCSTKQVPVDFEEGGMSKGAVGQTSPSFVFAGGTGQLAGGLHATYQSDATTSSDIGVRFFQSDLSPVDSPASLGIPHKLMVRCTGQDVVLQRSQKSPRIIAFGSDSSLIAFRSNTNDPLRDDAYVAVTNGSGCNEATNPDLVYTATKNVDGIDVAAGPGGKALVVFSDDGQVKGVDYSAGTGVGTVFDIGAGSEPRVSGGSGGWVVTYRGAGAGDDDGVLVSRVSASFTVAPAVVVNAQTSGAQDQPDVAVLSDGRFAVTWRSGGDIFFQRYASDDTPTSGDQEGPLQTGSAAAASPTIEGDSGAGYFVVAWSMGDTIRARFAGATSGFLFNPISGQNDDFSVTSLGTATSAPTIAVGAFIVVGWSEQGGSAPGIYARRIPVPTL